VQVTSNSDLPLEINPLQNTNRFFQIPGKIKFSDLLASSLWWTSRTLSTGCAHRGHFASRQILSTGVRRRTSWVALDLFGTKPALTLAHYTWFTWILDCRQ